MSKQCKDCNEIKPLEGYTVKPSNKDGYDIRCKVCKSIKENKSSIEKVVSRRYATQLINSAKRGHPPPTYSVEELLEWTKTNPKWTQIYENWKQSKYLKNTAPSFDRIDLNLPYTLENLQLVTWQENQNNHARDAYTGHETARLRPVAAYTKSGELHKEYYSIALAIREVNGNYYGISSVANGVPVLDGKKKPYIPRSYKGFVWKWI